MNSSNKTLAIIGARAGSKGLPDKNIRQLAGKPLLAWIIETAKNSKYVDRVIVSTDSEKYAELAKLYGAEVPYLRPSELATDESPEFDYVEHVVNWLQENENYRPDNVVRLFPTVPLQLPEDIDKAVEKLIKDPEAESAVVIAETRQHPEKALKFISDGKGGNYLVTYYSNDGKAVTPLSRQRYEKSYHRANIIVARIETIKKYSKDKSMTGEKVRYHIIPQERAIDIDSEADFNMVEAIIDKFK